jgi:SAM-dependent methyltransferase
MTERNEGIIRQSPTEHPSLPFDRVADRYDDSRGGSLRGAEVAAQVLPWLAPGGVLEVGVGSGIVAAALRARGVRVHGVDLSAEMLRRAVERLGPTVARADARALPVASAAVDNVLFVAALHAIRDVSGAVAEAARVLRPGGRLVAVHGIPTHEPDPDDADLDEAMAPLAPLRNARPDTAAAVDGAAASAGLDPVGTGVVGPARLTQSPNDVAGGLAGRLWSYLWELDERTWQALVEPTIARLRALPAPERPRGYRVSVRLAAFAAPVPR